MSATVTDAWAPGEVMREAAYLVARGVRPLALVGSCDPADAAEVRHALLTRRDGSHAIPFVVVDGDDLALYGYASHAWAVDLLDWAHGAPRLHRDRILGLLLGYSADAIRNFEELGTGEMNAT